MAQVIYLFRMSEIDFYSSKGSFLAEQLPIETDNICDKSWFRQNQLRFLNFLCGRQAEVSASVNCLIGETQGDRLCVEGIRIYISL